MNEKQKHHEDIPGNAGDGIPGAENLSEAEQKMNALYDAGDAAIQAALSSDSAAFLHAAQQHGGQ